MSDHVRRASEGAREKPGWLDGRARRGEYWLWIGPIMVAEFFMGMLAPDFVLFLVLPAGILAFLITIRRFHDLGWSGFAVPMMNVAVGVTGFVLRSAMGTTGSLISALISVSILIALGAIPGQRFANRYGPPRPGKKDVGEVFS